MPIFIGYIYKKSLTYNKKCYILKVAYDVNVLA